MKCDFQPNQTVKQIVCNICNANEIVYSKKISLALEENFCQKCFGEYIERKVFSFIENNELISDGDKIAIGASGGKDSQLLIHLLKEYQRRVDFEIIAIMIDEGIKNYREHGTRILKKYLKGKGIPIFSTSIKKERGYTIDEFVERFRKNNPGEAFRVCSVCDHIRMNLVKKLAFERECNKLAYGFNLDDHVISSMDALRRSSNPVEKFVKIKPKYKLPKSKTECILPLAILTDKEISLANIIKKIPYQREPECPYNSTCLDDTCRTIIYQLEDLSPGYRESVWINIQKLTEFIKINGDSWAYCEFCMEGYVSVNGEACQDCNEFVGLEMKAGYDGMRE